MNKNYKNKNNNSKKMDIYKNRLKKNLLVLFVKEKQKIKIVNIVMVKKNWELIILW